MDDEDLVSTHQDPSEILTLVDSAGVGNFGHVWRAVEKGSGRVVAVKVAPAVDKERFLNLYEEIRLLSACGPCEEIVSFIASYMKGNDLWIVMEFCDVGSAAGVMSFRGGFEEQHISSILHHVTSGVAFMHGHKLIHRDIKADNILLTSEGAAKLADLGVATQMKASWDTRNTAIGTPYWMAPELIREEQYNERVDIWSLGITAIELAETRPPLFEFLPMRALFMIANQKENPELQDEQLYSEQFKHWLKSCLERDFHERPSATELLLHRFFHGSAESQRSLARSLAEFLREREDESSVGSRDAHSRSWSLSRALLNKDYDTLSVEVQNMFFPLCESCSFIPEKEPWSEDFKNTFTASMTTTTASTTTTDLTSSSESQPSSVRSSTDFLTSPAGPYTMVNLAEAMRAPDSGLQVSSKYHRFRRFKSCFTGADATNWVMTKCEVNVDNAVIVGGELVKRGYIEHVTGGPVFINSRVELYRFCEPLASLSREDSGSARNSARAPKVIAGLEQLAASLSKLNVRTIENVGFLGRSYHDCFMARELVDLVMDELHVQIREEALSISQHLINKQYVAPVLPTRVKFKLEDNTELLTIRAARSRANSLTE